MPTEMKPLDKFDCMIVQKFDVVDLRFPTSLNLDGSDAVHKDPDYSCAYVTLYVSNSPLLGKGFTFTCGRGTEIVCYAIQRLAYLVVGKSLSSIFGDWRGFWRSLTNESQLRWLGPEKGVMHLAVAAIVNALWDLWAKLEKKPMWKLIVDMEPEEIVNLIDFHHITDCLTPEEALDILEQMKEGKKERENELIRKGVPAYVTSVGWMGYSNEKIKKLCAEAIAQGWTRFKMKVGVSIEDDKARAKVIRDAIGPEHDLMMDANQVWEVKEAVNNMKQLAEFNPLWIEEPTHPDDVMGHAAISQALSPLGIGVATGEHCHNRVMFKQLIASGGLQFCQIDACRLGGVNEVLAVLLMAAKYKVPVCPHAGGVGLCELVQHLAIINSVSIAPADHNTIVEFADHLHEHFISPAKTEKGCYLVPMDDGYSSDIKSESLQAYKYPNGNEWQRLINEGKHTPVN